MYNEGVRPSFATGFAQWPGMSEYPELWGGLVGAWDFSLGMTGGQVFDLSGNQSRYLGDLMADTTWKPGKSGSSLYFDGTDDYVKLQTWDGGPKVTFFARVKFDEAIGSFEQICAADSNPNRTFQFRRSDAGKLQFIAFVGGSAKTITGSTTLTTGLWWDVAAIIDGTNSHIYVNGISDATPIASGNMDPDGAKWSLGGLAAANWNITNELQGQIEFLMRWDIALSPSEITLLYQLKRRLG